MARPLSTGAKVGIGCAIVLVIGGVLAVVLLGGAVWWGKTKIDQAQGKIDEFSSQQERIEELQKRANATPFHEPATGVIDESRLVTFLEIRKRVYAIYKRHEPEIEARKNKKEGDLGDVAAFVGLVNDIRMAQASAQAELGMSDDEYRFLVQQIYKTQWATEMAKPASESPTPDDSPIPRDSPTPDQSPIPEDQVVQGLDVPPANVALFKKHEVDIRKYAMTGMEWIGL